MGKIWRGMTKLRSFSARPFRGGIVRKMRDDLRNQDFSIISSDCIGGILSNDLGLRFNSPTVNLYFSACDFIKLVERLQYYMSISLIRFERTARPYPVGVLDDIRVYFVHYESEQECVDKWESRKARINYDRVFLICTDRNGMTQELMSRYLELSYPKVIFVCRREVAHQAEVVYVPGFEKLGQVGELNRFADWSGHRYYEKYFNFPLWLNQGLASAASGSPRV